MDELLLESCSGSEVSRCIHIGLLCVQDDPADRPTMSSVVVMLTIDLITLPEPTNPAFFVRRAVVESNQAPYESHKCSPNEVTISDLEPR